ncbi:hypothetical protein QJS04_geneDACA000843 [Acorus gramineus]|uniref:Uncharacterized protein n=1 Tax=Acorus gramineus TaxID=55184 RepID=A0AAV9BFL6_ACOGR|nr:hypothetical protein QJS04_geneDACA000843 [Acorus gramineus]
MKNLRSFSPNMSAASASTTDPPRCAVPRRRRANNPEIEHSSRSESQSRSHTDYDDDDDEEKHQRSTETDDYPYTESSSVCANTTPPHSNYINVAPLPVFRGEPGECPVAHVTRGMRDQPGDRAVAEVKCGFCDGPHEEGSCEVRRRMRDLWVMSRDQMALVRPARQEGSISSRRGFGGQCQCWKHQCWKKNWRSVSLVNKDDSKDDLLK